MDLKTILLAFVAGFAAATPAMAGPTNPTEMLEAQGRTFSTNVYSVATTAGGQCVVSYDASQCSASGVPFACCTGVGAGASCACATGKTYGGNIRKITIQNIGGSNPIYCSSGTPTLTNGMKLAAGGSLVIDRAARGVVLNCIADTGAVNTMVMLESW